MFADFSKLTESINECHIPRMDTITFHKGIERAPAQPEKTKDAENLALRKKIEMEKEQLQRVIREKSIALKS